MVVADSPIGMDFIHLDVSPLQWIRIQRCQSRESSTKKWAQQGPPGRKAPFGLGIIQRHEFTFGMLSLTQSSPSLTFCDQTNKFQQSMQFVSLYYPEKYSKEYIVTLFHNQCDKCKNKQKQWNKLAMAHMWRLVYLYPSGCIELLWFAPCSSKPPPKVGSQRIPVSGGVSVSIHKITDRLTQPLLAWHIFLWCFTCKHGFFKTQRLGKYKQSSAKVEPIVIQLDFAATWKAISAVPLHGSHLGRAMVKCVLDVQFYGFFARGKGNKVCMASCFLGNGLSLAVCFWVFVCSLSFTVKTRQFFWDLVTVFWGIACLSPQQPRDLFG